MVRESEGLYVGDYHIFWVSGKLWIETDEAEGGEFDEIKFLELVDRFYKENF